MLNVVKVVGDIKVEIHVQQNKFFAIATDSSGKVLHSRRFRNLENALEFAKKAFDGKFSKQNETLLDNMMALSDLVGQDGWKS